MQSITFRYKSHSGGSIDENISKPQLDVLANVIQFQTEQSSTFEQKQDALNLWLQSLESDHCDTAVTLLNYVFRGHLPIWITQKSDLTLIGSQI